MNNTTSQPNGAPPTPGAEPDNSPRYWICIIGPVANDKLRDDADLEPRLAARAAVISMTGEDANCNRSWCREAEYQRVINAKYQEGAPATTPPTEFPPGTRVLVDGMYRGEVLGHVPLVPGRRREYRLDMQVDGGTEAWIVSVERLSLAPPKPVPVGLTALLEKARESQRLAELDLRAALQAATSAGPLWLCLYEQVETVARSTVRIDTIARHFGEQEGSERAAWEAGATLGHGYGDNYMHFEGEQKEAQWARYLARKGGAK